MTNPVLKMYREAKTNEIFLNDLKKAEADEWKEPRWYWSNNDKCLFASIYYGWLVSKGLYKKENYY